MKELIGDKIIAARRHIHSNPELGGCEFETASFLKKALGHAGIRSKSIARTGLVAVIRGAKKQAGKKPSTLALRADIDALPVRERTGKGYASRKEGVMHACGHDANAAMVFGAALELAARRDEFSGSVKLIFQPKEETADGAAGMIKAGALASPAVKAIIGVHVNPWLKPGVIGFKRGPMMAAVDKFEIEVVGDGGHGAYPHLGKDALVASAHLVSALQSVVSREINPVKPVVLTIGTIEGGERFNIICGRVKMVGTVRTLEEKTRKRVRPLMERKIRQITGAFGASYKFKYESLGNPLINDTRILEHLRGTAADMFGKAGISDIEDPSMGGEDFSEYLKHVPGCFVYVGTGLRDPYPWHHERFDVDESALPRGAAFLAEAAVRYLNS